MSGIKIDDLFGVKIDIKKSRFKKEDKGITLRGETKLLGVVCLENGYIKDPVHNGDPFFCFHDCSGYRKETIILYDGENTYLSFDLCFNCDPGFGYRKLHAKVCGVTAYVSQRLLSDSDRHILDYEIEENSID